MGRGVRERGLHARFASGRAARHGVSPPRAPQRTHEPAHVPAPFGTAAAGLVARWSRASGLGAPADTTCQGGAAFADSVATDSLGRVPPSVTIAASGDTTLGYNLEAHFDQQLAAGRTKDELWPLYFAGVRPTLEAADIAVVNLGARSPSAARSCKRISTSARAPSW
jgi:hypothetical protein